MRFRSRQGGDFNGCGSRSVGQLDDCSWLDKGKKYFSDLFRYKYVSWSYDDN